jgi:hypothetical protein
METSAVLHQYEPWNKGKLIGQKTPIKLKEIWAIRMDFSRFSRQLIMSEITKNINQFIQYPNSFYKSTQFSVGGDNFFTR